jgi:multicomponent Na+:H+ antiporter subunit G
MSLPPGLWPLLIELLSWAFILAGSFFALVGMIGLIRMPELFTRMHAASVTDTLGAGFLLAGFMLQAGLTLITLKLIFILLLLVFTGPVITHALAQAAMQAGVNPELAEDRRALDVPGQPPRGQDAGDGKPVGGA